VQTLEVQFQAKDNPGISKTITTKALLPVEFGSRP
jgi:hypothetical protein